MLLEGGMDFDGLDFREFNVIESLLNRIHALVIAPQPEGYFNPDYKILFENQEHLESISGAC